MVVPIYDDNPFTQPVKPYVTWSLIAANILVFMHEAVAPQAGLDRMINTYSLTPAALNGDIGSRGALPAYATLIIYQFFHPDICPFLGTPIFLCCFFANIHPL